MQRVQMEGIVPAVVGLACGFARDGTFNSVLVRRYLQVVTANLVLADVAERWDEDSIAERYSITGQALKRLLDDWRDSDRDGGPLVEDAGKTKDRKRGHELLRVTTAGAAHFMNVIATCEDGLSQLRIDYLLLSLHVIQTHPREALERRYPRLETALKRHGRTLADWDWKHARAQFLLALRARRKAINELAEATTELTGATRPFVQYIKTVEQLRGAADLGALDNWVFPALFPFRRQRSPLDEVGIEAMVALYESFDDDTMRRDITEGIPSRGRVLYGPGAEAITAIMKVLQGIG